jgi:hypothetical protein
MEQTVLQEAIPLDFQANGNNANRRTLRRIETRLAVLASSPLQEGLASDALWMTGTGSNFGLTIGSIFLPKKQGTRAAAVVAAVASAIQEMRTSMPKRLESRTPFFSVVDPLMYLGGRFNDAILKAAILRSSRRSELVRAMAADELTRSQLLYKLLTTRSEGKHLHIEIALAIALGKLSADDQIRAALLSSGSGTSDVVSELLATTTSNGAKQAA